MSLPRSTPEAPRKPGKKSFLFQGPPGGGKTSLALQFPGVCHISVGDHLDGPDRTLRKQGTKLDYAMLDAFKRLGTSPVVKASEVYQNLLDCIALAANDPVVRFIVIDNATNVNEAITQAVLAQQTSHKGYIEGAAWGAFKAKFINLLIARLGETGRHTILIAHEVIKEKPHPDKRKFMETVVTGYSPAVQGGILDYFGGYFSDVFACTCQDSVPAGNFDYVVETCRTGLREGLKNSMDLPPVIRIPKGKPAWSVIGPLIEPHLT